MSRDISRADAATLARQIGTRRGTAAARQLGEEIARAILDGVLPAETEPSDDQFCSCGEPIREGKRRRPFVAIACTCGNVWHRQPDSGRLILGHPPGEEEL